MTNGAGESFLLLEIVPPAPGHNARHRFSGCKKDSMHCRHGFVQVGLIRGKFDFNLNFLRPKELLQLLPVWRIRFFE